MMKRYVDFELQISSVDGQIQIDINGRPYGINLAEPIKVPLQEQLVNWKELTSSLVADLADRGYSLYSSVFVQEVESQFQAYVNRREEEVGVRLCLYTQSNDLSEAVWEILCSHLKPAFGFLALDPKTPVVRRARIAKEVYLREMQVPLKLLVVLASPRLVQKIDAVKEKSSLQEALEEVISEGQIEVDYLGFDDTTEANFDTLQEYLSRQETRYDVVHIIGHGLLETGEEGITALVKPENRKQQSVSASSLANLFRSRGVMLVILQSCQSGAVDSSVLSFSGVAQQLVACGVPAVLAMQEKIDQDVATYFLKRLYAQWLGAGCPFEDALTQARHSIYQNFPERIFSWAIPVLYICPAVQLSLNKESEIVRDYKRQINRNEAVVKRNEPEIKTEERQLDAALPQKTCVGKETELLILIRVPTQSGLRELLSAQQQDYDARPEDVRTSSTFDVLFPVDEKTGKVLPTSVNIEIETKDFDLSRKEDKVQLRPQGDSVLLIFPITPKREGTAKVYVFIYDNQEVVLAQLRLKSEVQIRDAFETEYRVSSTQVQTIICPFCGYENDHEVEFCTICGAELTSSQMVNQSDLRSQPDTPVVIPPTLESSPISPVPDPFDNIFAKTEIQRITGETARLILIDPSSPPKEFPIDLSSIMVGRFDADSGPVDIDLGELVVGETVSRNHAEIYREDGQWKVKDLGSTNGTFIRRSGEAKFSNRITKPEILNSDDEIAFGKVRFIFKSP